jgi:hypothetical protein
MSKALNLLRAAVKRNPVGVRTAIEMLADPENSHDATAKARDNLVTIVQGGNKQRVMSAMADARSDIPRGTRKRDRVKALARQIPQHPLAFSPEIGLQGTQDHLPMRSNRLIDGMAGECVSLVLARMADGKLPGLLRAIGLSPSAPSAPRLPTRKDRRHLNEALTIMAGVPVKASVEHTDSPVLRVQVNHLAGGSHKRLVNRLYNNEETAVQAEIAAVKYTIGESIAHLHATHILRGLPFTVRAKGSLSSKRKKEEMRFLKRARRLGLSAETSLSA